jgi:hypothetical protein
MNNQELIELIGVARFYGGAKAAYNTTGDMKYLNLFVADEAFVIEPGMRFKTPGGKRYMAIAGGPGGSLVNLDNGVPRSLPDLLQQEPGLELYKLPRADQ